MMGNFDFLLGIKEYEAFAPAAVEAEKVYATSPAMCAIGCRKALELAVKWVYAVDTDIQRPFKDNLQSLIHGDDFYYAMDYETWKKLPYIVKLGNLAVHTDRAVTAADAVMALRGLFEFIEWIDYCYGREYKERHFQESLIPQSRMALDEKRIKEQASLLREKEEENRRLLEKVQAMSAQLTAHKEEHKEERHFNPETISEFKTRKVYIDVDMKMEGWVFDGPSQNVWEEYEVEGMAGVPGQPGYVDYVLFGRDGLPLAVVEAKKTSRDANIGRKQAVLYADCLERKFGRRPMIFNTNGFDTYFWDDQTGPQRKVSGIFSQEDLQRLMNRRQEEKPALSSIPISDAITNRAYQKEAIRAVCAHIEEGGRKNLLVMATGTGKTRTAASLVDVLSKGNRITNVLFLADRTALVKQARDAFKEYLPRMTLCNLCSNKDDKNARMVFSTYPTILNAIDDTKRDDGNRLFTPAHFDLIIIDESHRSIFKKYKEIFDYFDAILVGLTATPKTDVDRNTYDFFDMQQGIPTYAYDYNQAIEEHFLVPYYNYEVKMKFLEEGITYDDLSPEDKKRYEDDFTEDDGSLPDYIPSPKLDKFVFNADTVDRVLQDLMERGIKVDGDDRLGKTIIFAENKRHAEFIIKRFNVLYPKYKGTFAQRVVCGDTYVETIIDDFKQPQKDPVIAVSVDMLDTGIDVPECVNLVFFKKVRSRTKFWQMIGRGTRLCPDLDCVDSRNGEYIGKKYFLIFDYCGNFEYFRQKTNDMGDGVTRTLSENIFIKRIRLIKDLQEAAYADKRYQDWRTSLVETCHKQVMELNTALISVKLHLRYVEKYKNKDAFRSLSEGDCGELNRKIAPLVEDMDKDESAKRFDNFMYGLMLSYMEGLKTFQSAKKQLKKTVGLLKKQVSIDAVRNELPLMNEIESPEFWTDTDVLEFENVRVHLRELIQFIGINPVRIIETGLKDRILGEKEGDTLEPETFEDYKEKVDHYFLQHMDDVPAVKKLVHNEPLTEKDYKDLERIFTVELGTKDDYNFTFGGQPFGLTVRHIAKMDPKAAEKAFSEFINEHNLNDKQIAFIHNVINYIAVNGYMDSPMTIMKAPFDRPYSASDLFSMENLSEIVHIINGIRDNAIRYN
jgi:type I restriction enzyme R subunit